MNLADNMPMQSTASQIHTLSCDSEMACTNLSILLKSIVKSLDDSGGDVDARIDEINCFVNCAKPILATVMGNSLAMAKLAREVQS